MHEDKSTETAHGFRVWHSSSFVNIIVYEDSTDEARFTYIFGMGDRRKGVRERGSGDTIMW